MDKNSIIGLSIIGLLIVGYSIFTQPSKEELAAARHKQDSIAALQVQEKAMDTIQQTAVVPVNATDSSLIIPNDSILAHNEKQQFGDFYEAANGTEQLLTLENTKIKVEISSKGGRIRAIELKDYKSWQGKPVRLFSSDSSVFNLTLSAQNRIINTEALFFQASGSNGNKKSVTMRLPAGDNKYIEYVYTLEDDSYLVDYKINVVGLQDLISQNAGYINLDWKDQLIREEQSLSSEREASTVYYRFAEEDVDFISYTTDEKQSLKTKVKWISFKQHFFNVTLIAENSFDSPVVETFTEKDKDYVKSRSASFALPYER
jgi:YidC/Oxa1 family membrane protein insertase